MRKNKIMIVPKYYRIIKEKEDGIKDPNGVWNFPILFKDTLYVLPEEIGSKLVTDGYAIETEPLKGISHESIKS